DDAEIYRMLLGLPEKMTRDDVLAALPDREELVALLRVPNAERLPALRQAFRCGIDLDEIHSLTAIDPWFLESIRELVEYEQRLPQALTDTRLMREAKQLGYSDRQIALSSDISPGAVRAIRKSLGVLPTYKLVDTCAAEFAAETPYYYSTWEDEGEIRPSTKARIMILGGGPNRIGQGIEFDYCSVHSAWALQEGGRKSIMINSNPETVSTDFDTSDRLYFEALDEESVADILENETGLHAPPAVVQFGGQTAINLAGPLY
ncbi:MAG: carbamoyl phosphate synthase large subunit, partial [Acidimicrobiales bacterium]|nr:carbamoyl phosphate synthase large subunit [Acidimicrobiales bacterium]